LALSRTTRTRLLSSGGLALAVALLLAVAYRLTFFSSAQIQSTDFLFPSRATEQADSTVIVGIDQRTYRELLPEYGPPVNWPRTLYARMLDALGRAGARVVAFDILFDVPRPEDPDLAAAIARFGNVVLPVEARGPKASHPGPGVAQAFDVFVRATGEIRAATAAEGTVNVTTDRDTVVRSLPLLLQAGEETIPAFALAAVARFVRRPAVLDGPPTDREIYAAGRAIPIAATGSLLINFLGPPSSPEGGGAVPIISLADVLAGAFDAGQVRDKIVLIGWTTRGVDEFATPTTTDTRMWGVEVQANAVETLLSERYLVAVPPAVTIALIVTLALTSALLVAALGPFLASIGTVALLGLYFLAAGILFDAGILPNLFYPPVAIMVGYAVALIYRVVFEQAQQKMIRGVMARYLSPSVSQWVLRDPDRLKLGGETRTMTVLFCDLRGFTTFSHALPPQALVGLLNDYMTAMTQVVFRYDGVLDKYIGDAIMAFWNAPLDQPDHARRACETALDMIRTLLVQQEAWARRGLPKLEIGIGINTGPMVVGNMGARDRLAYTVMGDAVNVSSRLEGLSKEYGTRVVIGEATRQAAGDLFAYRFLDVVAVKGRSEPLAVFEVLGPKADLNPLLIERVERYQAGIELYRARQWAEAAALFAEIHATAPEDGPTSLYLRRSQALDLNPPSADWDGVYVATTK
jgi:adenylate cyclase